ncbi:MAG: preprotein translocase subunit SecE [Acidiferrobacteraceae bacterium]
MNADRIKLVLAVLVLGAGIYGFYYLDAQPDLVRVSTVLGAGVVAAVIALQSAQGRAAWEFGKGARTELRKVVWPSRKETFQATLAVIAIVILIALFLWLVDWGLSQILTALVGPRS